MFKDYILFFIAVFITISALVYSVAGSIFPEYNAHQKKYYELNKITDYDIEVNQINLKTDSGLLVDRCGTCHMGAINKLAGDFPQPLRKHSGIAPGVNIDPHNLSRIGCVVCHDGNGRGLTKSDAHGKFAHWYAPLLKGKMAQANCARCHDIKGADLKGASLLNKGKRLYFEKGCWSCHTIEGVSSGKIGPVLSDAGGKFSVKYLDESIVNPIANIESSRMPKFNWIKDRETVMALVVFLKSQRKNKMRDWKKAPIGNKRKSIQFYTGKEASGKYGRIIFHGKSNGRLVKGGCINCHSYKNNKGVLAGGNNAPELTYAYRARGGRYIKNHVINPKKDVMDTIMPAFENFTKVELQSLVMFLKSLTYETKKRNSAALYTNYCSRCHGKNLNGKGLLYKLLDPVPRNFKRYFVAAYRKRFKQSIENGVKGTAMPPWKKLLSAKEIKSLIKYIDDKSVKGSKKDYKRYVVKLPEAGDPERRSIEEDKPRLKKGDHKRGRNLFQKFCVSCHGKLANGKGPNAYALEHPLPRNLLNKNFFNQKTVHRQRLYDSILLGVPGTPMHSHDHLKDQWILDLIEFIIDLNKERRAADGSK